MKNKRLVLATLGVLSLAIATALMFVPDVHGVVAGDVIGAGLILAALRQKRPVGQTNRRRASSPRRLQSLWWCIAHSSGQDGVQIRCRRVSHSGSPGTYGNRSAVNPSGHTSAIPSIARWRSLLRHAGQ